MLSPTILLKTGKMSTHPTILSLTVFFFFFRITMLLLLLLLQAAAPLFQFVRGGWVGFKGTGGVQAPSEMSKMGVEGPKKEPKKSPLRHIVYKSSSLHQEEVEKKILPRHVKKGEVGCGTTQPILVSLGAHTLTLGGDTSGS